MLHVPTHAVVMVLADKTISVHAFLDGMEGLLIAHSEYARLVQLGQIKHTPQTKHTCQLFVVMRVYAIISWVNANASKVSQAVRVNVVYAQMTVQVTVRVYR